MSDIEYVEDAGKLKSDEEFELCCYNGGTYTSTQDAIESGGLYELNTICEGSSAAYDMHEVAWLVAQCLGYKELHVVFRVMRGETA